MKRSAILLVLVCAAVVIGGWVFGIWPRGGADLLAASPGVDDESGSALGEGGTSDLDPVSSSLVVPSVENDGRVVQGVESPDGEGADRSAPNVQRTLKLSIFGRRSGLPMAGVEVVHSVLALEGSSFDRRTLTFQTNDGGQADVLVEPGGTIRVSFAGHARWSYDVPQDVEDGELTVLLNAHATLYGRIHSPPPGSKVGIRQALPNGEAVPAIQGRHAEVGPNGEWSAKGLEIASEYAFAASVELTLYWSSGQRPIAEGLTLRPGDDHNVPDTAEGQKPWSVQFVYPDGEPLSSGVTVSVRERAGIDAKVISRERADGQGRVRLSAVPPGRWHLELKDDGGSFWWEAQRSPNDLDLKITLDGVGRVEGQVVSALGKPVEGLQVQLSGPGARGGIQRTSDKGRFAFQLVALDKRPTVTVMSIRGFPGTGLGLGRLSFGNTVRVDLDASGTPAPLAEVVAVPGFDPLTIQLELDEVLPSDKARSYRIQAR